MKKETKAVKENGGKGKWGNGGIGGGYGLVEFFGGRRKALGLTHSTDEAKKAPVPVRKQLGNTSSGFSWVRVSNMYDIWVTTGSKITVTITADGIMGGRGRGGWLGE